jgi:hypothetical protein
VRALVADGTLSAGNGNALWRSFGPRARASTVATAMRRALNAARAQLRALLNQLDAFVSSGKLTAAQAGPLADRVNAARAALGLQERNGPVRARLG